ncbi:lipid-A-disaccharide synthase [Alishewanella sp. d11]|uniref:lipid-A-disaccharide synthase n=1 Tax=Alishewanella sp. d11 TaxID=3414030 RepID=UPI003BF82C08
MANLDLIKHTPLKVALIAGEHSGDILGAALMVALKQQHPNVTFFGIGGPRMQAEGFTALFEMEELAVMGLVEVLGRLRRLLQVKREITTAILAAKPDVFIGIDAPDFNLPVELALKQHGIKTVHYVSPSVWAWRHKRIFKIAKATNMVLALLPFEKAFYDKYQVPCTFVGHTLADTMPLEVDKAAAKLTLQLDPALPVLAIMPGSRTNEIRLLAPTFLRAAATLKQQYPALQLVTNMVTPEKAELWRKLKAEYAPDLEVVEFIGQARQVLLAADSTFIASGTATLEAMLAKCAMVVGYRTNWLTFQIAKRLVKLQHVSLPNLLAGRGIVTELLQDDLTLPALVQAMQPLLSGITGELADEYRVIHQQLKQDASAVAATTVLEVIADE